ncbi:MAG: replication initiator protein A, partial [Lentilitoribacter sp.]
MTSIHAGAGGAGMLSGHRSSSDFFVCDVFDAALKDDLATMEHPIFSLSTKPDRRILKYEHNGYTVDVTPSVRGRATMHDKDIVIYCISQLMAAMNAGREISRTVRLRAHDLLVATNRDTGGDSYVRLREGFERLAGTRITTNITSGGIAETRGFGLIESWGIVRRAQSGRMVSVTVTLSDWLFRAVLSKSVLTLNRDYFKLRKPLERRVYELARKHCGRQPEWKVTVTTLHKKSGSAAPLRVFRAAIRKMIAASNIPDYSMSELDGDIVCFVRKDHVVEAIEVGSNPVLSVEVLERVRQLVPGQDVYALEAEWLGFWASSGRARLLNADKAFEGWVVQKVKKK